MGFLSHNFHWGNFDIFLENPKNPSTIYYPTSHATVDTNNAFSNTKLNTQKNPLI